MRLAIAAENDATTFTGERKSLCKDWKRRRKAELLVDYRKGLPDVKLKPGEALVCFIRPEGLVGIILQATQAHCEGFETSVLLFMGRA